MVIGFAGTSTHGRDLDMIAPALLRVYHEYADSVKFVFGVMFLMVWSA